MKNGVTSKLGEANHFQRGGKYNFQRGNCPPAPSLGKTRELELTTEVKMEGGPEELTMDKTGEKRPPLA